MNTGLKLLLVAFGISVVVAVVATDPGWLWIALPAGLTLLAIRALTQSGHDPAGRIGAIAYLGWMAFVVVGAAIQGVPDSASDPQCDAFCITTAEGWLFRMILGSVFAAMLAFVAFIITAFIIANRRAPAAR